MTIIKIPPKNNFPEKVEKFKLLAEKLKKNEEIDLVNEFPEVQESQLIYVVKSWEEWE